MHLLMSHGPCSFVCYCREKRVKTVLGHNEEDDTVIYQQAITYFFEPELSNGSLDDVITVPNIPLIVSITEFYVFPSWKAIGAILTGFLLLLYRELLTEWCDKLLAWQLVH